MWPQLLDISPKTIVCVASTMLTLIMAKTEAFSNKKNGPFGDSLTRRQRRHRNSDDDGDDALHQNAFYSLKCSFFFSLFLSRLVPLPPCLSQIVNHSHKTLYCYANFLAFVLFCCGWSSLSLCISTVPYSVYCVYELMVAFTAPIYPQSIMTYKRMCVA